MRWSTGSRWQRWDPHLHAPGTLRNDQFAGDWLGYIERIEDATPAPVALGITDYFTLRAYKEVLLRRQAGALQSIPLIFPNVELRLTIETEERRGINIHLLVCPDRADHVTRVEAKLAELVFPYKGNRYPCSDDGLRRLGRAYRTDSVISDEEALREGANQFKVELDRLRELFERDEWMSENVLIGVAAGKDGLSGIAKDATFRAQREELGRFAHIVFSGNPSDRSYWLGNHQDFAGNAQRPKPCLHGCDAHSVASVLLPDLSRRCWIKAEPSFDGLRQTLVEPGRRVYIGELPPQGAFPSDVITAIRVRGADWLGEQELALSDGLVTIIGAKGSGKTALADLLAFAASAEEDEPGPASFLAKAGSLLDATLIEIEWGDGSTETSTFPREAWLRGEPRVRYLSQQFVEQLCAPGGLAEPLLDEIERVVFSAIPAENRLQCSTFSELREMLLEDPTAERDAEREGIRTKTRLIAEEAELKRSIPALQARVQESERALRALRKDRAAIPATAGEAKVRAQQEAATRLQSLKDAIAREERRAQELKDVAAEIRRQVRLAEQALQSLRSKHPELLDAAMWESLQFRVENRALGALTQLEAASRLQTSELRERGQPGISPDGRSVQGKHRRTRGIDRGERAAPQGTWY